PSLGPPKQIWIIWHSIVQWANTWASRSPEDPHLGLSNKANLSWLSKRGMLWDDLLTIVWLHLKSKGLPDVTHDHTAGKE
ncbi:hypothetical protein JRQ81_009980, partial [Phrynocephalus forsythii]